MLALIVIKVLFYTTNNRCI